MNDMPERVRLRDTGLYDDLGGGGQRIYTTAGQGYPKTEYVRADLCSGPNAGTIEADAETLRYVSRFGGFCRDCADEDGICPGSGLPCQTHLRDKAIRHVLAAVAYGIKHGYLRSMPTRSTTGETE